MSSLRALVVIALIPYLTPGQSYKITTVAGGGLPEGIGVSTAIGGLLNGIAVDRGGNVYFSLMDHDAVLRLDPQGFLGPFAGNGTAGFSGDGGPAQRAQLWDVYGVAVDQDGNLYIADVANNRVRKVSNGVITTVAGNGFAGYSGDGGPAAAAQLRNPRSVAVDSAGNLYIADSGNARIRRVSNGVITTVAGNGTAGLSGDGGPAVNAQLSSPSGLAVDSAGNLYIADWGNIRIRKISNGNITTVAGNGTVGSAGDGSPALNAPISSQPAIAVDAAGGLYIADGDRIRKVSNGVISTIAGISRGFSGDGGPATQAQLNQLAGIAIDGAGNLYVTESGNRRVRKISGGIINTIAGGGVPALSSPADAFELTMPSDVRAINGDLYIADQGNFQVLKVSRGQITRVAGNGTPGYSGDGGLATNAQLSSQLAVAVDSAGVLYISDSANNCIRKVAGGIITTIAGTGTWGYSADDIPAATAQLYSPHGIGVDAAGSLYIAEAGSHRVRKISNGVITTIAGNGTAGYSGDNGPATSGQLKEPWAVAIDSAGAVYVADRSGSRIRKIVNGIITTAAGNGTYGFGGDGGPAAEAQLSLPEGLAADSSGNLYISDQWRIRKVSNGIIGTIAGSGALGFSGDNGPAVLATVYGAGGIAVDAAGTVYIADSSNDRIRALIPAGECLVSAVNRDVRAGISAPLVITTPSGLCRDRQPF